MKRSNISPHLISAGLIVGLVAPLTLLLGCGDEEAAPPAITISVSGPHSAAVGATASLAAITLNGSDTTYTWVSADPTLATVDDSGRVTGVAAGETEITVTGGQTAAKGTHPFVVLPEVITGGVPVVTISGVYAIPLGGTATLMAITTNGTDSAYTWTSNTPEVISVDADGVVSGNSVGNAVITAEGVDTGRSASFGLTVTIDVPVFERWASSKHADRTQEAFRHWDGEESGEIPADCARCHSSAGFADFVGADGTPAGTVDSDHPLPNGVSCVACHTDQAIALSSVTFPSGVTVDHLGSEARCMTCHQGRGSTDQVDAAILAAGVDNDVVSGELSFINQHYYAAGATLLAGEVRGGYQYEGQVYDWRFRHVEGRDTCQTCHDPHSLKINKSACETCHSAFDDPKEIRMLTSREDFDGDGNVAEGIAEEITTLREDKLLVAMQAYVLEMGNAAICYDNVNYPYFFKDTNGDAACGTDEANFGNRYDAWTPRLLRAAYNYQVAKKDPGGFAHNSKYMIQILFDAITDLNSAMTNPIDMTGTARTDTGHFNGAGEAARHWDADEEVSASCSKCHSGSEGYAFFLEYGVGTTVEEQANGLECATCHINQGNPDFALRTASKVVFPSGDELNLQTVMTDVSSNLCGQCHSGRESGLSIVSTIASANVPDMDTVSSSLRFRNVHYKPAAATLVGTAANVGFEYASRAYAGAANHLGGNACVSCHKPIQNKHSFLVEDTFDAAGCSPCHDNVNSAGDIRGMTRSADIDGDGNSMEQLKAEIGHLGDGETVAACAVSPMPAQCGLSDLLLIKLQDAATVAGTSICYNAHAYPYWFVDDNNNRTCDAGETTGYGAFTGRTLKAAYNYQYSQKEPGAWAHNFNYMAQILIDTIEDLGGDISGLNRP